MPPKKTKNAGAEVGIVKVEPLELANVTATKLLPGYAFAKATAEVYIENIRTLAERTDAARREAVCAMVLLGRYCRDVKHEIEAELGHGHFGDWLHDHLPKLPYATISLAMRVAADLSQKHPELRKIDTEEKVEQLTLLIDGRNLTAFGRALRGEEPAGEKRPHHPSAKTPVDRHDDLVTAKAANATKAVETLEAEYDEGNFAVLTDDAAEALLTRLRVIADRFLDEVVKPRREAAKATDTKKRRI